MRLQLWFAANLEHPQPLAGYRPIPVLMPEDLLSACWLQFCLRLADFDRDWRICKGCDLPFQVIRQDQSTCPGSAACKKNRQLRENSFAGNQVRKECEEAPAPPT